MFESHNPPAHFASQRPLFVALEGLDGTGKSSHIRWLNDIATTWGLQAATYQYTRVRTDRVGKIIHYLYKSSSRGLLQHFVARSRLLQELLFSHQALLNLQDIGDLDSYDLVLCDRCAVTAFIAHPRLLGSAWLAKFILNRLEKKFVPDHVIYLQVSHSTALTRIASRKGVTWRDENTAFIADMEERYRHLIEKQQVPAILKEVIWHVIDAETDMPIVQEQLCTTLYSLLETDKRIPTIWNNVNICA